MGKQAFSDGAILEKKSWYSLQNTRNNQQYLQTYATVCTLLIFYCCNFHSWKKNKIFLKHNWLFYSKLHLPEALIECRRKQPFPCFPAEQHHLSQGCHLGVTGCELCHSHPAKLILSCRCAQCQAPKENNNKFQQCACENNWFSGPLKFPVFINKRGV